MGSRRLTSGPSVRKGPCLSRSGLSFGSLDRHAKPLLQFVGVDALVVAPFRGGASEEHDALRREGDENVLHRLERIALTGDAVSVDPGVVESLDGRATRWRSLGPFTVCLSQAESGRADIAMIRTSE